jgi:glycosyltransferase involved in cell wall biosynthesis
MRCKDQVPLVIFCPRDISGGSHNYWLNLIDEERFLDLFSVTVIAQAAPSTTAISSRLGDRINSFVTYPDPTCPSISHRIRKRVGLKDKCPRTLALKDVLRRSERRPIVWFVFDSVYSVDWCHDVIDVCIQEQIPYHLIVEHVQEHGSFKSEKVRDQAGRFYGNANQVVFVSLKNWQAAEAILCQRLPNATLGVNGLTEATFDRAFRLGKENPPSIHGDCELINVARYEVLIKRQDLLLQAIAQLRNNAPRLRTTLVGGSGSDLWYLKSLAIFLGLDASKIRFIERTDDPIKMVAKSDFFALTSESEGMAFALVEAAACCRPLLATNVAGAPEIVINRFTGYLAKSVDLEGVSTALLEALNNREAWPQFGLAAHELARSKYCLAKLIDQIYEVNMRHISE